MCTRVSVSDKYLQPRTCAMCRWGAAGQVSACQGPAREVWCPEASSLPPRVLSLRDSPRAEEEPFIFSKKKKKWLYTLQLTLLVLSSVITAWNPSDPNSHVLGGFQFHNGELTIPYTGRYYVYAQMYFCNRPSRHRNRVLVSAGNRILLMMNKDIPGDGIDLTASAGGVFVLSAGERLSVQATMYDTKLYLSRHHCYFGAYMVSAWRKQQLKAVLIEFLFWFYCQRRRGSSDL